MLDDSYWLEFAESRRPSPDRVPFPGDKADRAGRMIGEADKIALAHDIELHEWGWSPMWHEDDDPYVISGKGDGAQWAYFSDGRITQHRLDVIHNLALVLLPDRVLIGPTAIQEFYDASRVPTKQPLDQAHGDLGDFTDLLVGLSEPMRRPPNVLFVEGTTTRFTDLTREQRKHAAKETIVCPRKVNNEVDHPEKGRYAATEEAPCRTSTCLECWGRMYLDYIRFYEGVMPIVVFVGVFARQRRDAFKTQSNRYGALRLSIPVNAEPVDGVDPDLVVGITDMPVPGYTERPVDSVQFLRATLPFYRSGRRYSIVGSTEWAGARKQAEEDDRVRAEFLASEGIVRRRLYGRLETGVVFAVDDACMAQLADEVRQQVEDFDTLPPLQQSHLVNERRRSLSADEWNQMQAAQRQLIERSGGLPGHQQMEGDGLPLPEDVNERREIINRQGLKIPEDIQSRPKPGQWTPPPINRTE